MLWDGDGYPRRKRLTGRSRRWGVTISSECSSPGVSNHKVMVESTNINLSSRRARVAIATAAAESVVTDASGTDACLPTSVIGLTSSSSSSSMRPSGPQPVQLTMLCIERMQEPLRLMQLYWMKWRCLGHRKGIFLRLQRIRATAVSRRVLEIFYKWRLFAYHVTVVRLLDERLVRHTLLGLAHRYWRRWLLSVKLWRKQKAQLVALRAIRNAADRQLVRRQYARWQNGARLAWLLRQRAVSLSTHHARCLLHRYYLHWMRLRRKSFQTGQLKQIRHQWKRTLARRSLQRWMLCVSRRIVACNVERITLEHFVCRFLVQWRRYAYICKSLRRIRHAACWRIARRSFQLWKFWLIRICFALRLELRSTVLLLHPFFMRWMLLRSVRRLEYGSVACKALCEITA